MTESTEGTPQGAVISPLLANIYLHYVYDLWADQWRKREATGEVIVVRYADDTIVGFERQADAERFLRDLRERLAKFGLALHPDKTRLIEFGRYAAQRRSARGEGKPETFDFLGFTHICGKAKEGGWFTLVRHTIAKRMRAKLVEIKEALNRMRHVPVPEQGRWLGQVVRGYLAYHAVPTNSRKITSFLMNEHSLLHTLLCATTLGFPAAALAQQSQWIVTGADVAQRFAASIAEDTAIAEGAAAFAVASTTGDRTVAELAFPFEYRLQDMVHTEFHRCGGYTVHPSREAAIAEATNPFYRDDYLQRRGLFQEGIDQQAHVGPALDLVEPARIVETISWMQEVGTRYFESAGGQQAAEELKAQWESYAPGRGDFSVELYDHSWTQDSVIATIRGAELPDEIVVVGAHLDSINPGNIADAPGADDDASGVAAVSEVLRAISASGFTPRRTLQFMAYAAEEVGLRGSTEIAEDYAADPSRKVVAALQMDMTGFAGSPQDMYFITDYVSADLTEFLKDLIGAYNGPGPHAISFGETACGYGCSDHVAWTGIGVPAAFPFEALFEDYNEAIHTPGDFLERLDTSGGKQAKFAKLGIEFMIEVAKSAGAAPSASAAETLGFVWGADGTSSAGAPAGSSGYGPVTGERDGVGSYEVTFAGLGQRGRAGVEVQVAAFGAPSSHCLAGSVAPAGQDLVVSVRCEGPDGAPVDSRHSVLVTLP